MLQESSGNQFRSRRTRNERKRERQKTVCMAIALALAWMVVLTMMVKSWATHPAEQPISGEKYIEYIGGDPDVLPR